MWGLHGTPPITAPAEENLMIKKALFDITLLALWASLSANAQADLSYYADDMDGASPQALTTLGDNGQIVNDAVRTVTSITGECKTTAISPSLIDDYCGDDNGCVLRLVTRYTQFIPHPPTGFAIDPVSGRWRVSVQDVVDGLSYVSGRQEDNIKTTIIATDISTLYGPLEICRFHDDYVPNTQPTGYFFGLQACWAGTYGNTTCTLTIQD